MILIDDDAPGSKSDLAASSPTSSSVTRSPAQLEDAVVDSEPSPPPYTPRTAYNLQQQQLLLGANAGPSNYGAIANADSSEPLQDQRPGKKLGRKARRRFLRAFIFAVAVIAFVSFISPRYSSSGPPPTRPIRPPPRPSPPQTFLGETVIDCLVPGDWDDRDKIDLFSTKDEHGLRVQTSWLDLSLSTKDIFIVSNAKHVDNIVVMDLTTSERKGARVQLVKAVPRLDKGNSTICLLTRGEGTLGFGIMIDPEYDTKEHGFAITFSIPRQPKEYNIRKFEVDIERLRAIFANLDGYIRFEEFAIKSAYGDITSGSVSADRISIEMLNGPVAGMFTGAESLDITAESFSFMEVDVLLGGNGKNSSRMSLTSHSSPINARINLLPPDPLANYGGKYNVSTSSTASSTNLQIGNIPARAEVNIVATADSSSALLNLPAIYEGNYLAKSQNRVVYTQPVSVDPYGLGRRRRKVELGASDDMVSRGLIWWGDELSEESVMGNIEVQGRELSFISFN